MAESIKKILVPIDGSESSYRAARLGADLARKYGAELFVVHGLDLDRNLTYFGLFGVPFTEGTKQLVESATREVEPWFERVRKEAAATGGGKEEAPLRMTTEVIEAPLSIVGEIVNYAEKNGIDLIVMGSRGRTGFKKLLLGSVASGVVSYAHCPVLVVK